MLLQSKKRDFLRFLLCFTRFLELCFASGDISITFVALEVRVPVPLNFWARKRVRNGHEQPQQHRQRRQQQHSGGRDSDCSKGAITSTIKHAIKHKTSTARLAQLDGTPSLAASYSKMLMRAATVVQQLRKSCRTCFMFHCMFYFTCDRSLTSLAAAACHVRRCLFTLQYDAYG